MAIYRLQIKQKDGTAVDLPLNADTLDGKESSHYLDYDNLINKPTIPAKVEVDSEISSESENPVESKAIYEALAKKQDVLSSDNSQETNTDLSYGTSSNYDVTSDTQLPTTKATKKIVDNAISTKANSSDVFTKIETENLINESLPTKTSELTNDSGFITNVVSDLVNYYKKNETYTQTEINNLISAIPKFNILVVTSLPTSNISSTTIYLKKENEDSGNLYTEYIYTNNAWEILGSQKVDLTGYATEQWVEGKGYLIASDIIGKVDKTTTVNGKALSSNIELSKSDIGLGNVDNTSDLSKPISTATQNALDLKEDKSNLGELAYKDSLSKSDVGLGNVNNTSDLNKPISTATQTALDLKENKANLKALAYKDSLSKSDVGLGNVVNTGDSATPVSGGTTKFTTGGAYTELAKKVDKVTGYGLSKNDLTDELLSKLNSLSNYDDTEVQNKIKEIETILTSDDTDLDTLQELVTALKNNTASINDIFTAIASKQDKLTFDTTPTASSTNPVTSGGVKTALDLKENKSNLKALAYKDSLSKSDVGLGNVNNTSDLNKPISTATQTALDLKENKANLKALAYKDSLTKSDVGLSNVNNVAITQDEVTQITTNKNNITTYKNQMSGLEDRVTLLEEGQPDTSLFVPKIDIVDNLTSTATDKPLSAYQGKLLGERVTNLEENGTGGSGESSSSKRTYNKQLYGSEWLRIAKVNDIAKNSSGIFTLNCYGINELGVKSILTTSVFSVSCGLDSEGNLSTDVFPITQTPEIELTASSGSSGSSGGSSSTSGGDGVQYGLSNIKLEQVPYENTIYAMGLFSFPMSEMLYSEIEIEMKIENNLNFAYLDDIYAKEIEDENAIVEGMELEDDVYYIASLENTFDNFIDNTKTDTMQFSIGNCVIFSRTFNSVENKVISIALNFLQKTNDGGTLECVLSGITLSQEMLEVQHTFKSSENNNILNIIKSQLQNSIFKVMAFTKIYLSTTLTSSEVSIYKNGELLTDYSSIEISSNDDVLKIVFANGQSPDSCPFTILGSSILKVSSAFSKQETGSLTISNIENTFEETYTLRIRKLVNSYYSDSYELFSPYDRLDGIANIGSDLYALELKVTDNYNLATAANYASEYALAEIDNINNNSLLIKKVNYGGYTTGDKIQNMMYAWIVNFDTITGGSGYYEMINYSGNSTPALEQRETYYVDFGGGGKNGIVSIGRLKFVKVGSNKVYSLTSVPSVVVADYAPEDIEYTIENQKIIRTQTEQISLTIPTTANTWGEKQLISIPGMNLHIGDKIKIYFSNVKDTIGATNCGIIEFEIIFIPYEDTSAHIGAHVGKGSQIIGDDFGQLKIIYASLVHNANLESEVFIGAVNIQAYSLTAVNNAQWAETKIIKLEVIRETI